MATSEWVGDPLVIDPPGFDDKAAWQECRDYVDRCGGLVHEDGEPNWRAAFGADPGCCSCPDCGAMYWAWGRIQECRKCGFRFPTDWWSMFSYGTCAARRGETPESITDVRRSKHKYYRWAYEHKDVGGFDAARAVNWREVFPEDAVNWHPVSTEPTT